MEITLEQIELVKDKTGASYKEAKDALEKANGSVVDAIVAVEDSINEPVQAASVVGDVFRAIKAAVKRSNARRLIIKNGEELFADIPLNIGLIDLFFSPWAAVTALVSFLGNSVNITLVDEKGKTTDITAVVHAALGKATARTGVVYENLKTKGIEYAQIAKEKGAEYAQIAKEKGAEYAKIAKEKGTEYAQIAKEKGAAAIQAAKDKGVIGVSVIAEKSGETIAEAVEKANAAFDTAKDKLTDLINERAAASKEILMDDEDLFSEIEEEFKDEE